MAHLWRNDYLTQIRREGAAESVGRTVRKAMLESGGTALERLPKSEDIRNVRKGLKGAHKHIDKPKAKKRLPPPKG